jgi:cell division protein FtsZ
VNRALSNPLLEVAYNGATGALIHITGGEDFKLDEVSKIGDIVTSSLDPDANVIWGARIEKGMEGKLRVMTIITGVTSPYVLGKVDQQAQRAAEAKQMGNELGIDNILH